MYLAKPFILAIVRIFDFAASNKPIAMKHNKTHKILFRYIDPLRRSANFILTHFSPQSE